MLIGNGGQDVLDGGPGNNVIFNSAVAPGSPAAALLGPVHGIKLRHSR